MPRAESSLFRAMPLCARGSLPGNVLCTYRGARRGMYIRNIIPAGAHPPLPAVLGRPGRAMLLLSR